MAPATASREKAEAKCVKLLAKWKEKHQSKGHRGTKRHQAFGSDVPRLDPSLRTVRSPYDDGEELLAVPALRLDAALVHVNRADARGSCQLLGPDPFFDDLFCQAAERAYVSAEQIVPTEALAAGGPPPTLSLNRMMVTGVVAAPGGAHFTRCRPDYERDEAYQKDYARAAKAPDTWASFYAAYLADERWGGGPA